MFENIIFFPQAILVELKKIKIPNRKERTVVWFVILQLKSSGCFRARARTPCGPKQFYCFTPTSVVNMSSDVMSYASQSGHAIYRGRAWAYSIWSAICFKIMTRYTCSFFPRILAIIPATRYTCVSLPRILAFFLTNAHIYALQTSMWYMGSQKVVV